VPVHTFYKPQGVPLEGLKGLTLTVEGLEALRLSDADGMEQAEAAEIMRVSRPTFSRILAEARGIVARALSSGWALHIEGGHYRIAGSAETEARGRRRGRGRRSFGGKE
jgi:predicted DNA-binding protein (UPF0251 family)